MGGDGRMKSVRSLVVAGFVIFLSAAVHAKTLVLSAGAPASKAGLSAGTSALKAVLPVGTYALTSRAELLTAEDGDTVTVIAPDGGQFDFQITNVVITARGNVYVSGDDVVNQGRLTLSVSPSYQLTGRADLGGERVLFGEKNGTASMTFMDEAGLQYLQSQDDGIAPPVDITDDADEQALERSSAQATASTSISTIDLLVLYEPSIPSIANKIDYLINYTNELYGNSEIGVRFRLAASKAYSLATTDDGAALDDITIDNNTVDEWRTQYRGDMVTFLRPYIRSDGDCGVAWIVASNGNSFSSNNVKRLSFNVTNIGSDGNSFCGDDTLAHELGHNFGAQHNRENAGSNIPYYPYAYGDGIDEVFGTVMSYQRPNVPYFSNPSIVGCNGYYCGRDNYTDVARAINNVHPLYEDIFTPIAPSQPSIVSTDYGNEEIYLSVSVSNNGGSTISTYTATCTDGTSEYTGTSSTSRITVSGLTNGVGYSCSVTATNAAGTSTASASSPPIVPEYIPTGLPIWLLYEASNPASP
jgi:hypothetical protein